MPSVRTTVFRSNRTQAVRLPKAVALPERVHAVDITVVGEARVITPAGGAVDYWFDRSVTVTADFLSTREQGEQERHGL